MSNPRLPAELLDHVVDFLHDDEYALRDCCLLSKSWISRIRKHLFADVGLYSKGHLDSWKEMFPDPSKSPGRYAKALFINPIWIKVADIKAGGWIRAFFHIVRLRLTTSKESRILQHLPIFDLILSFPLLEDLTAVADRTLAVDNGGSNGLPTITLSSTPPMTGTLKLFRGAGMEAFAVRLLSTPGVFRFWKLSLTLTREEDLLSVTALVEGCSQTLKCLNISSEHHGEPGSALIDLSKATGLEKVTFQVGSYYVGWVTMALQTITTEHRDLRQISIYIPLSVARVDVGTDVRRALGETICRWWSDLDRLLVEFWESRFIRPRVGRLRRWDANLEYCVGNLLLEITKKGIVDLV